MLKSNEIYVYPISSSRDSFKSETRFNYPVCLSLAHLWRGVAVCVVVRMAPPLSARHDVEEHEDIAIASEITRRRWVV